MNCTYAHEMDLLWLVTSRDVARAARVAQRRLRGLPTVPTSPIATPQPWHVAMRAHARR